MSFWMGAFVVILLGLTGFAAWKWYEMRGTNPPAPERQVFARFALGLAVFWLLAAAMYFGGPLLAALR
jgi:hypothetical protein